MHDSLSTEEGPVADDESTSDRGGGGLVDEVDDDLAHLNDLDVTWGLDSDAFLQERAQQAPAAGDATDRTAETIDSSQGDAVDSSSAPTGRAEADEWMGSSQGGSGDAFSVPAGRADSDPGATAASDTDQGNRENPPAVLSDREAHELSSWGRLPTTVRGRTRSWSQRLQGEPAQRCSLTEAVYEWTKSGSMLNSTSRATGDAMTLMDGDLAVESKGELSVRMPSGFQKTLNRDRRSRCRAFSVQSAWHEAWKITLDGHKMTGTYEAATPPRRRKPVDVKWGLSCKTDKEGLIVKTKARLAAKAFSRVQVVDYFQTFAPTPSSSSVKFLAVVTNEQILNILHLDVAQVLFARNSTPR